MKRAIIIGASGFLGKHLFKELKNNDLEVFAVEHSKRLKIDDNYKISGGIRALHSNLIDEIHPDLIFHCARPSLPKFKRTGRILAAQIAKRNNKFLLSQLRNSSSKPLLLFASGSLMYGNSSDAHTEKSPLNPISYARQYHTGEKPILQSFAGDQYPTCMFRLPWLLGAGSWFKWFYLDPINKQKIIPETVPADNLMEIVDVRDAAELMVKYGQAGIKGIYNIPSEKPMTSGAFNKLVSEIYNVIPNKIEKVFPSGLEKEALEAFSSNISLKTGFREILDDYTYRPIAESLKDIKDLNWE